jgi:hypothetical protein
MSLKPGSILNNIKKTFALAAQNKRFLALSVLADLAFFAVAVVVFSSIQTRILEHLYNLVQIAQSDLTQISNWASSGAYSLLKQPEFAYDLGEVIQWIAILMLVAYFVWGFLQGLSWICCFRIVDKKWKHWLSYLSGFFLVNVVWISIFYAFIYTWVKLSVYAAFSMFPIISQDFATGLFLSSTLLLAYFATVSYPLLKTTKISKILQKTLLMSIAQSRRFVPMFLVVVAASLGLLWLYSFVLQTNIVVFFLVSVFVTLPLIALIRLFVTLCVSEKA